MVLFTGKTVEEAIDSGLKELKLPRFKAHIKVVSREKKGFFGFGKKLAQVDIESISDQTAHKADQKVVRGVPDAINSQNDPVSSQKEDSIELNKVTSIIKKMEERGTSVDQELKEDLLENKKTAKAVLKDIEENDGLDEDVQPNNKGTDKKIISLSKALETVSFNDAKESVADNISEKESDTEQDVASSQQSFEAFVASEFPEDSISKDIEEAAQKVSDYVQKIIYEMDIEVSIDTSYNRRQINLQVETPEAGRVIGYHGKVLKSLQLLAQNFLHDHYSRNFSVEINVHDYMEHRMETLIEFTRKAASRVLESGKDYVMDPMTNSERKIVHKTITGISGVESYSEGNDPNRYVVVTISE